MTLAIGTRLASYETLALLGKGGMGEVYRARDTKLGREVAIKVADGQRFLINCALESEGPPPMRVVMNWARAN